MWKDSYDCRSSLFSRSNSIELSFRERKKKKKTKNGKQSPLGPFLYFMCTHISHFLDQTRWNQVLCQLLPLLKRCKMQSLNKSTKSGKNHVYKVVFTMQLLYPTPCSPPALMFTCCVKLYKTDIWDLSLEDYLWSNIPLHSTKRFFNILHS